MTRAKGPADAVKRYLRDRGARPDLVEAGLPGLVKRWATIVDEIARGYQLTLDDYLNDMDVRDMIAGALAVAGTKERDALERSLAEADRKLHELTTPSPSLWGPAANIPNQQNPANSANLADRANLRWWYFRKPRHPGKSLEADLARLA